MRLAYGISLIYADARPHGRESTVDSRRSTAVELPDPEAPGLSTVDCRLLTSAMDLHALQMFRAVATEKSFSRAAVKLARTQPAVSLAVQRLEAQMGEPLIDR